MMAGRPPLYSVSVWSTPHNTIREDLDQIARSGARGVGLWEGKFAGQRDYDGLAQTIRRYGLRVTSCAPRIWTIFPVPWASPTIPRLNLVAEERDPRVRIRLICDSLGRLAAFAPECILVSSGAPDGALPRTTALEIIAEGLARIADAAAEAGLKIGFELTSARRGSPVHTLTELAGLIDDVRRPNVGIIVDIFHSAPAPGIQEEVREHVPRLVGVHVNDVPWTERGPYDRLLPGEGRNLAPGFIAALLAARYRGWYELEVFSDDGTFGVPLAGSLWAIPHEELLRRGKEAFERVYRTAAAAAGVADASDSG
ncbi:MAG: sugar phosphate isomerase/epimerase [Armatimonadota bacterium]|nr:sugar phosphate isomerase/epimerase [Armatimonadota bacterium]MDR7450638.1 sugar phosphate isomerase/epimerase [Armatimonadota bacterium]MDR7466229.1 sugar phosphate isomerase/epimerase [Armatimonadota bacterium]MDR7492950.1 sugar phosphate isomerase/epimerase [Armatimonadota bacterium]MDR7498293.1 sugar phosphate isomerase/epimerase [Armatimonadota bacterium]